MSGYSIRQSLEGVGKGTGQGLTVARSVIVDKHGGTLTFETETGRGTTFVIRLPLAHQAEQEEKDGLLSANAQ